MREERLMILNLLEEGKITEDEAEKLLDALGDMEYDQVTKEASSSFNPYKINLSKNKENQYKKYRNEKRFFKTDKNKDFDEMLESLGKRFEDLGEQFEDKIDLFSEQFGKKMVNLGSLFADKSINFAEKIMDVVEKAVESDPFVDSDLFGTIKTYEEVIEKDLSNMDDVSLQFESLNGSISINRWDEPIIKVTSCISIKESRYESNKPMVELKEDMNTLYFSLNQVDGIRAQLNILLPNKVYHLVKAKTTNGLISAQNLNCNKLLMQTKNASIQINHIETKTDTSLTTTNSKIMIQNCKAENLLAATKNNKILIDNSSIKRIEGLTSNGKITIKDVKYNILQSLSLKTTNCKIEVIGSASENTEIQFDASTTHGDIHIGIPVVYEENIKNYSNNRIKAKTSNFDTCINHTYIKAYTTNSSIYLF